MLKFGTMLVFNRWVSGVLLASRIATFAAMLGIGILLLGCSAPDKATPTVVTSDTATLLHGPIAGAVTDTQAQIWVHTSDAANVTVAYSTSPDLANSQTSAPGVTQAADAFQGRVQLNGLKPVTAYYYNVLIAGKPQLPSPLPHFETFAPRGVASDFSFGILTDFGSVHAAPGEVPVDLPTFAKLAQEMPQFVVIGGDFWHNEVDTTDAPIRSADDYIAQERSRYLAMYSLHSSEGPYDAFVQTILPNFSLVHFWDDHDIGFNNSDKNFFYNVQARQVLQQSFPTYPLGAGGDWQSFTYGQADFFILDARSQRDSSLDPDTSQKSMLDGNNLGATGQWDWLINGLKNSQARWKFIFSPVVFNPTMKKTDAWHGFKYEHDALVKFIRDNHIGGVIILSGDAHAGAMDDGTNAGLPEMLTPGPNMQTSCFTAHGIGTWSNGYYGTLENLSCPGYSMVHVLTNPDRVVLQVKNDAGDVKLEMQLQ